jgi:hypothetical protein
LGQTGFGRGRRTGPACWSCHRCGRVHNAHVAILPQHREIAAPQLYKAGRVPRTGLGDFDCVQTALQLPDIVQQNGSTGTAAVFQSMAAFADRATLIQSGLAPVGVIQQGVLVSNARNLDSVSEVARVRSGTLVDAVSTQSTAILLQAGGSGLAGVIVQSGASQSASITQSGSNLEAEIVQAGGAHTASIVQTGVGSLASPYRASIQQFGAQPQSFSIQQTVGSSPRVVRVVQQ